MKARRATRTVRVPGVARLPEGEARKILVPAAHADLPPLEVLLVRTGGKLFALDTLCPHEGGRIGEGPLWEGGAVVCPLHLYRFDPRTGQALEVECDPATTYPVRELDGVAELELPREPD